MDATRPLSRSGVRSYQQVLSVAVLHDDVVEVGDADVGEFVGGGLHGRARGCEGLPRRCRLAVSGRGARRNGSRRRRRRWPSRRRGARSLGRSRQARVDTEDLSVSLTVHPDRQQAGDVDDAATGGQPLPRVDESSGSSPLTYGLRGASGHHRRLPSHATSATTLNGIPSGLVTFETWGLSAPVRTSPSPSNS